MTREERELSIEYLEGIKDNYIEGHGYERHPVPEYYAIENAIKALEQQDNTWSLDDAREDFMHDVYNTLDFLPTNNEANRIIDIFDRVTKCIKQQPCEDCHCRPITECEDAISRQEVIETLKELDWRYNGHPGREVYGAIYKLQPVQPKPKAGHWIDLKYYQYYNEGEVETTQLKCSRCNDIVEWNLESPHKPFFCENCGADMRVVESEKI